MFNEHLNSHTFSIIYIFLKNKNKFTSTLQLFPVYKYLHHVLFRLLYVFIQKCSSKKDSACKMIDLSTYTTQTHTKTLREKHTKEVQVLLRRRIQKKKLTSNYLMNVNLLFLNIYLQSLNLYFAACYENTSFLYEKDRTWQESNRAHTCFKKNCSAIALFCLFLQ